MRPNGDRLSDPTFGDRSGQLGQAIVIEVQARLRRILIDQRDREEKRPAQAGGRVIKRR